MRKFRVVTNVVAVLCVAGVAQANPIDNPGATGAAVIKFAGGSSAGFIEFSNSQQLHNNQGLSTINVHVDSTGVTYWTGSGMQFNATSLTLPSGGPTIEAQLNVTDLEGSIDCSAGGDSQIVNWEITADMRFRAGSSISNPGLCHTGSFTIEVSGSLSGPSTFSTSFTIPALSGTGSGACAGFASTLNGDFGLGSSGVTLELYKAEADQAVSPFSFLVGS